MTRLAQLAAFVLVLLAFAPATSHAQISNQPFAFDSPGGLGMSTAAKQAIMNQQISGSTPDVLLVGPSGGLLQVDIGPDGVPIVTGPDGQGLPGYRGRSWKGSDPLPNAGVFNPYFAGVAHDERSAVPASTTGQVIDAWTTTVVLHVPPGFGSSVDQWVMMAYYLGPRRR